MNSPTILIPKVYTTMDRLKDLAWPGRNRGTLGGSLVADMSELQKALVLCGGCQHKFDYKRHGYYSVWKYENQPVIGPCDVCKLEITGSDGRLFIHENMRHKTWATPDEQRARLTTKRRIGNSFYKRR